MTEDSKISFIKPVYSESEIASAVGTIRNGWTVEGAEASSLKSILKEMFRRREVTLTASATDGLYLVMKLLRSRLIQRFITTPYTFASTVHAIERIGVKPEFCDINDWGNLDAKLVNEKIEDSDISPDLTAVVPIDFAGIPFYLNHSWRDDFNGATIVVDAAHSFGSFYHDMKDYPTDDNRYVGERGDFVVFSFHPTKQIVFTPNGGGAVTYSHIDTDARLYFDKMKNNGLTITSFDRYSNLSFLSGTFNQYDVTSPGINAQISEISAAVLASRLSSDRHKFLQGTLMGLYTMMTEVVEKLDNFKLPEVESMSPVPSIFQVHFDPINSEKRTGRNYTKWDIINYFRRAGIECSTHFIPLHITSYYAKKYGYQPSDFPNAEKKWNMQISLPYHPFMSDYDVQNLLDTLIEIDEKCTRGDKF